MSFAPIALFAYNRPTHIQRAVESLLANELAPTSDLCIFSDGPKSPAQEAAVADVRRYSGSVSGFRSVTVVERPTNLGLANSIIDGTTRMTKEFGRVIVLEDDLVLAPHFLKYMNLALERYRDEDRVFQVSGHMFQATIDSPDDAIFLPFVTSWGWGTWDRAWAHFDPNATGYLEIGSDPALKRRFNLDDAYDYFGMLEAQLAGNIDSWAIRWYLSVFRQQGLALYPKKSLVDNFGFDGSGEHCGTNGVPAGLDPAFDPVRMPEVHVIDEHKQAVFAHLRKSRSLLRRIRRRVDAWFG